MKKIAIFEIVISALAILIGIFSNLPFDYWLIGAGVAELLFAILVYFYADMNERKIGLLNQISEDLTDIKKELKQESSQSSTTGNAIFYIQKDISDIKEELLSNLGEDYVLPPIDDEV